MAQKPEDSELKRLNLENLQKQEDKSIYEILENASHTTLYRFDNSSCQWDRVGVEGTTFIVLAKTDPIARLIVLNKLDVENYTLDLAQVNKVKLQTPYLMLRLHANNEHKIMGLWFHNDEERAAIKNAMERAMAVAPPITAASSAPATTSTTVASVIATPTPASQQQEFSLESLSQSTTEFHHQTHKDGAPIELDSSLPNNFNKVKKEKESTVAPPAVTVTSGSGGKMKGLALLNSLKSNTTTSSDGDELLTDYAITTAAQSDSQADKGNDTATNHGDEEKKSTKLVLFAPSDITGVRRQFLKQ